MPYNHGKSVFSTRLGITYDVSIKRYNEWRGKDPYLKQVMEPTTKTTKDGISKTRLYYKEYDNFKVNDVRTHNKWNVGLV